MAEAFGDRREGAGGCDGLNPGDTPAIEPVVQAGDCELIVPIDRGPCIVPEFSSALVQPTIVNVAAVVSTGTTPSEIDEAPVSGIACLYDIGFLSGSNTPYYKAAVSLSNGVTIGDINNPSSSTAWAAVFNTYDTDDGSSAQFDPTDPDRQDAAKTCELLPVGPKDGDGYGLGTLCVDVRQVINEGQVDAGDPTIGINAGVVGGALNPNGWALRVSVPPAKTQSLRAVLVKITGPVPDPINPENIFRGLYYGEVEPAGEKGILGSEAAVDGYYIDTAAPADPDDLVAKCPVLVVNTPEYREFIEDPSPVSIAAGSYTPWISDPPFPEETRFIGVVVYDKATIDGDDYVGSTVAISVYAPAAAVVERVRVRTRSSDSQTEFDTLSYGIEFVDRGDAAIYDVGATLSPEGLVRRIPHLVRAGEGWYVNPAAIDSDGVAYTFVQDDLSVVTEVHLFDERIAIDACLGSGVPVITGTPTDYGLITEPSPISTEIQHRRGTTLEHSIFTGLAAEITIDTDKVTAVVHDGATAGGFPLSLEGHAHSAADITSGTLPVSRGGTGSTLLPATFNYSPTGSTVQGHLAGIDNALGAISFTGIDDTPATFVGSGLYILRVNAGETAVEFVDASSLYAAASHTHAAADIASGTLAIAVGGTNSTTLPTPSNYTPTGASLLGHLEGIDTAIGAGGGGGATAFTGLTDTPASYAGAGLDLVRVNAGATALEFVDTSSLVIDWSQLSSIPSSFTPAAHTHTLSDITDAGTAAAASTGDFEASGAIATHAALTSGVHGISVFGASLIDDADASTARSTLGLGTAAVAATGDFEAAGAIGTHAAVVSGVHGISTFGASLVDDADASTARSTLGLGSAATSATGDFAAASHAHAASDITSGTLAVSRGGTGSSTLPALPTNYTEAASTVTGHLSGIDDALGVARRWDRIYAADGGGSALSTGGSRTVRERRSHRIDGVTFAMDASDSGTLTITIKAAGVTQHTGTASITTASESTESISWDTGDGTVEANETITVERTSGFSTATTLTAQLYGVEV